MTTEFSLKAGSARQGIGLAVISYAIWALYPFYWVLVLHIGYAETYAHRMVWSLVFIALIVLPIDGLEPLRKIARSPKLIMMLCLSAILIGTNWLMYIYAVAIERIIEASLGYFMSPIFAAFSAMIFLRERLHKLQYIAVAIVLAGIAVALFLHGQVPWLGVGMATTFALYSTVRSHVKLPATTALTLELIPASGLALIYLISIDGGTMMNLGISDWLMMMLAGPSTVIPLLLYGLAVNRAPLVPVALLFYIVPSALLIISVGVFDEVFRSSDGIVFGCAWSGLALYGVQVLFDRKITR